MRDLSESLILSVRDGVGEIRGANKVIDRIKAAPTADVVEVRHGEWVLGRVEPGYATPGGNRPWICSECGQVESWRLDKPKTNFCSNCGAKMDGKRVSK